MSTAIWKGMKILSFSASACMAIDDAWKTHVFSIRNDLLCGGRERPFYTRDSFSPFLSVVVLPQSDQRCSSSTWTLDDDHKKIFFCFIFMFCSKDSSLKDVRSFYVGPSHTSLLHKKSSSSYTCSPVSRARQDVQVIIQSNIFSWALMLTQTDF